MQPAQIEALESRELCSTAPNAVRHISSYDYGLKQSVGPVTQISYDQASGLKIVGTDGDDRVTITEGVTNLKPVLKFGVTIIFHGPSGTRQVVERFELDKSAIGTFAKGRRIQFTGKNGDDFFRCYFQPNSIPMNIYADGGAGKDELWGGPRNDLLIGGPGNDHLNGMEGDDVLIGGSGNDTLRGDAGNDLLCGSSGQDNIGGGKGDDILEGGDDGVSDVLAGEEGKDWYVGEWYRPSPNAPGFSNRDTPILEWFEPAPAYGDDHSTQQWEAAVNLGLADGSQLSRVLIQTFVHDDFDRATSYVDPLRNLWGTIQITDW